MHGLTPSLLAGKTCEDKRRYKVVHVVKKNRARMQKLINEPTFQRAKKYGKDLVVFQMRKDRVVLDKPRFIGSVILNISKCIMYRFHFTYIMKTFPNTKVMFSDTDSFLYHIETEKNLDAALKSSEWFDFSNYPKDHFLYDESKRLGRVHKK